MKTLEELATEISESQKEKRWLAETKMDAKTFNGWLDEMKSAGLAASDAECASLLGVTANSVVTMKKRGADRRTALACRALLHRLQPYS